MTRGAAAKATIEYVMRDTAEKLASIMAKLDKLDGMERAMEDIKTENQALRLALQAKDDELTWLNSRVNELEQYNRSWSVRVLNVPLTAEEEKNNVKVADKLYDLVLKPILEGAVESGTIPAIPPREHLLETAHVLPGKPGKHKPIIARFLNRDMRSAVFQHKKESAPRRTSPGPGGEKEGSLCFPLFEDLTRTTFLKMRALATHKDVKACWSINGQLRYKLNDSDIVRKVSSVFDTVEKILQ